MRNLSEREQDIFVLCLIMISVFIVYTLIFKPFKTKILSYENQIYSLESNIKDGLELIDELGIIDNEFNLYSKQYKQNGTNEEVMASILSEIQEAAKQITLQINDLKPKRVKKDDIYNTFSVSLIIESDFENILKFLYVIQQAPHLFDIEEVKFEKGRLKTSSIKTNLVLTKIFIP